jgi:acetyltransferase-like isoleucine patch superfamily enzyme
VRSEEFDHEWITRGWFGLMKKKLKKWFGRKNSKKHTKPSPFQDTPYRHLKAHVNIELELEGQHYFNGLKIQNDGAAKVREKVKVSIGDGFHCGPRCEIRTSDHDYEQGYPVVNGTIAGYAASPVHVGKNVWLGSDVLIMKGVVIGDGAIVQARSVVVSDIPKLAIAGGHPCRVFGYRNEAHYEALLKLGLQHEHVEGEELARCREAVASATKDCGPAFVRRS